MMSTPLDRIWPPHGVRISCGPVSLATVRDEDFPELDALVHAGIHPVDQMPFLVPWTVGTPEEVSRRFMQYHWSTRGSMNSTDWRFETTVRFGGAIVGCQALSATDFPRRRTAETGSWIGRAFQHRGIGTLARHAMCAFAFHHLSARRVVSSAFVDNPASAAVSVKVGYQEEGTVETLADDGRMTVRRIFALTPDTLTRSPHPVTVTGAKALREMLGIDRSD